VETVRKTSQEKHRPTLAQERELERILWRCRTLYKHRAGAAYHAVEATRRLAESLSAGSGVEDASRQHAGICGFHSHVLEDVLARLDKTYHAFFHRVARGEQPGFPRFHGKDRYHCFTYKEEGNGAQLDNGSLDLSKIGRVAVRWSRPIQGTIETLTISKEAEGW
jgi:putative transposase